LYKKEGQPICEKGELSASAKDNKSKPNNKKFVPLHPLSGCGTED
jgi:hypothetical protein